MRCQPVQRAPPPPSVPQPFPTCVAAGIQSKASRASPPLCFPPSLVQVLVSRTRPSRRAAFDLCVDAGIKNMPFPFPPSFLLPIDAGIKNKANEMSASAMRNLINAVPEYRDLLSRMSLHAEVRSVRRERGVGGVGRPSGWGSGLEFSSTQCLSTETCCHACRCMPR